MIYEYMMSTNFKIVIYDFSKSTHSIQCDNYNIQVVKVKKAIKQNIIKIIKVNKNLYLVQCVSYFILL